MKGGNSSVYLDVALIINYICVLSKDLTSPCFHLTLPPTISVERIISRIPPDNLIQQLFGFGKPEQKRVTHST